LRYSQSTPESTSSLQNELAFLKMRYKLPGQSASVLREQAIMQNTEIDNILLREVKFAGAVAGFAQLLKDAKYTGEWTMDDALSLALANRGEDNYGYRSEFVQLIRKAQLAEEL
jgi:Ca-activated chloride channel family protein